jgi:hypothetical protein
MFQNMIPLWHVGALAEYAFNDIVDIKAGIVNGANSDGIGTNGGFFGSGFLGDELTSSVPAFLFSLGLTNPGGNATLAQNVYVAPDSRNDFNALPGGLGAGSSSALVIYDVVGNWVPKFANDKLLLGFNIDLGNVNGSGPFVFNSGPSTWFGAAAYAKYQFTDLFSLAGRFEYVNNYNSAKFGSNPNPVFGPASALLGPNASSDLFSWTLTAGFDLAENLLLRAEYRLDAGNRPVFSGIGASEIGHTIATQVVYSF